MPELAEIETLSLNLNNAILGLKITEAVTYRDNLRTNFPKNFCNMLANKTITSITRLAKYIQLFLDDDNILVIHLGMSGRVLIVNDENYQKLKHDHVILTFSNNSKLVYNDPRRFGLMDIIHKSEVAFHPLFINLGPDPFSDNFTPDYLFSKLKNKKSAIKLSLMNNEVVVGVGNIYASESLFRAKIHPSRPACEVKMEELARLVVEIRQTLTDAINSGGSTLRDYVKLSGESGGFQHHFKVYGKDKTPCTACKTEISKIIHGGRSSYFCVKCQV